MKKRIFLSLGLIALFLVLITGLTGCDSGTSYRYEYTFYNQSNYTIHVDFRAGFDMSPHSFDIRPGSSQKCGGNTDYTNFVGTWFDYRRTDTGSSAGIRFQDNGSAQTGTFYNN